MDSKVFLAFPCLSVFVVPVGKRHSENIAIQLDMVRHTCDSSTSEVEPRVQDRSSRLASDISKFKASLSYMRFSLKLEKNFNSRKHSFI